MLVQQSLPREHAGGQHRRLPTRVVMIAVIALCAAFLFLDPSPSRIMIWDESRLMVNALEMRLRGFGLVTTYGFAPDLWNTKPPLAIWAMLASVGLFGPSEWALRLPSALAALGTLLLVFDFTFRVSRSQATAAAAALMLAASIGFFGEHGAHTADYDALLCLCVTGYLHQLFFAVHRRPPGRALWIGAGALAAGLMTKGIAAPIAGIGLLPYLAITGRLRRTLRNPAFPLTIAAAFLPLAVFLLLREQDAPGYLAASLFNDVGGRFTTVLSRHATEPFYYLGVLAFFFSASPLLVLLPIALPLIRGRERLALLYMLCAAGAFILAISAAATRFPHYVSPALPPLAIATALAARTTLAGLWRKLSSPLAKAAMIASAAMVAALLAAHAADLRWRYLPTARIYPSNSYGALFQALAGRGARHVTIVDPGVVESFSDHYAPHLRAYALIWRERGLDISVVDTAAQTRRQEMIGSCVFPYAARLAAQPDAISRPDGCAAAIGVDAGTLTPPRSGDKRAT